MKKGDRNTSCFHKMTNSHKRGNAINKIRINGAWLTDDNVIQKGIVEAFHNQLGRLAPKYS